MILAKNADRVLDITVVEVIALLEQLIELAEQFASQGLVAADAGDLDRRSTYLDPHPKRLFDRAQMAVVLAEQASKGSMVVKLKFERIVSQRLSNGFETPPSFKNLEQTSKFDTCKISRIAKLE